MYVFTIFKLGLLNSSTISKWTKYHWAVLGRDQDDLEMFALIFFNPFWSNLKFVLKSGNISGRIIYFIWPLRIELQIISDASGSELQNKAKISNTPEDQFSMMWDQFSDFFLESEMVKRFQIKITEIKYLEIFLICQIFLISTKHCKYYLKWYVNILMNGLSYNQLLDFSIKLYIWMIEICIMSYVQRLAMLLSKMVELQLVQIQSHCAATIEFGIRI